MRFESLTLPSVSRQCARSDNGNRRDDPCGRPLRSNVAGETLLVALPSVGNTLRERGHPQGVPLPNHQKNGESPVRGFLALDRQPSLHFRAAVESPRVRRQLQP